MAKHRMPGTVGILGLLLASPSFAFARLPTAPNPTPSPASTPAPSFRNAVAAAWARLPQRRNFVARQGVAASRYAAGGAFFPNAPFATGSYVNDKVLGSNYNYITTQAELGTPIWLPGEGTATQSAAQADAETAAADSDAAHLALALQVLDLAAQGALA